VKVAKNWTDLGRPKIYINQQTYLFLMILFLQSYLIIVTLVVKLVLVKQPIRMSSICSSDLLRNSIALLVSS